MDLRFNVSSATWISDAVKARFLVDVSFNCKFNLIDLKNIFNFQHKTKINKEGFMILKSDVTRYQQLNLADALEKLRNLIREAEKPTTVELSPETVEKIRRRFEMLLNS